jgi:hypothetical protein
MASEQLIQAAHIGGMKKEFRFERYLFGITDPLTEELWALDHDEVSRGFAR